MGRSLRACFVGAMMFLFSGSALFGGECESKACNARVDIGPAAVRIDVLESGDTVDRMEMFGLRGDISWLVWKGFCLKPTFMTVFGDGDYLMTGIGLGHCFPLSSCLVVTPSVGFNYSYLQTKRDFAAGPGIFVRLRQKISSTSPYAGIEAAFTFWRCWRLYGSFQYAWSHSVTTIEGQSNIETSSSGPNYALVLERDINQCWSVNIGIGYNLTLSKERHGFRGSGAKLGIVRWF